MVVERPFRDNGAEKIHTVLVKVGVCNLKCVLKVVYMSHEAVSNKNMIRIDALQWEQSNTTN